MKTFHCHCGNRLYFENTSCLACGRRTGFLPRLGELVALEPSGGDGWRVLRPDYDGGPVRLCENFAHSHVCNWLLTADESGHYCQACRLNRAIPDLSEPGYHRYWRRIEAAKRRLVYTLNALGLPVPSKQDDPDKGLGFAFLADPKPTLEFSDQLEGNQRVMTGHASGLITINIAEADDVERERMRKSMRERYRTLLGHFRHEIGHYYWLLLVQDSAELGPFRHLFGDERADYQQALRTYYDEGPRADWSEHCVSAYASSHPWEDWAESFAHYLHMVDTLEAARHLGYLAEPDPAPGGEFAALVAQWVELTIGMNELNRSMGLRDAYPFVLSPKARDKLAFVHDVVQLGARRPLPELAVVGPAVDG
jgi:hypothetical protein